MNGLNTPLIEPTVTVKTQEGQDDAEGTWNTGCVVCGDKKDAVMLIVPQYADGRGIRKCAKNLTLCLCVKHAKSVVRTLYEAVREDAFFADGNGLKYVLCGVPDRERMREMARERLRERMQLLSTSLPEMRDAGNASKRDNKDWD